MPKKEILQMTRDDLGRLEALCRSGETKARVVRRANILRLLDQGKTRAEVAQLTGAGVATVGRTKRAYREGGLDEALYESQRSGRPVIYGDREKKKIIALACTDPPPGRSRWTLSLLITHCGLKNPPTRNTVHLMLKEAAIRPWRKKNVVYS